MKNGYVRQVNSTVFMLTLKIEFTPMQTVKFKQINLLLNL